METPELIHKVHEDLEGRYDLTGEDLYFIHAALCEYAQLQSEVSELKAEIEKLRNYKN
jgi:hypothetical protein